MAQSNPQVNGHEDEDHLTRVQVGQLRPGMYVHDLGVHWGMHPFLHSQFELDQGAIEKIRKLGVKEIVIDTGRGKAATTTASEPTVEEEAQAVAAHEEAAGEPGEITREARQVIRGLLEDARAGKAIDVKNVEEASAELSAALTKDRDAMLALGRIRSCDGYTYQHSVNSGVLFMAFAKYLGFPEEKVRLLGTAGMLHDIGKVFVPEHILTKPGKLTDEEYKTIQAHAFKGGELLRHTDGVDPVVIKVAEQHHERVDGTGYPCRLARKNLDLEVQISSIIDVYDALTAIRAYHKGRPPTEGLAMIMKNAGKAFDNKLTQLFIRCIGVYPPGSLVRLTGDRLAVVVEPREAHPHQPLVRVIYDLKRERELDRPYTVDLSAQTDQKVVRHEDPENWFIRPEHYLAEPRV